MKTIEDISIRLCEEIECDECPVYLLKYETRTESAKNLMHVPCCFNLEQWIKDTCKKGVKP